MLDSNTIVTQVRAGTAPGTWQVLRPNRSYYVSGALGGFVLAIGAIAAAVYLFVSGTIVGYGVSESSSDGYLTVWFFIDMLVLLGFLIGGIALTIGRIRAMGTMDEQMLVLMPDGYLLRKGPGEKDTALVSFERMAPVQVSISNGEVFLLAQQVSTNKTLKLAMDSRFGKPKLVAQQILALYGQYKAARVQ